MDPASHLDPQCCHSSILGPVSLRLTGFNRAARSNAESPQIKVGGYVYPCFLLPPPHQPLKEVLPDMNVKAWTGTLGKAGRYRNPGLAETWVPGLDSCTPADLGKHTVLVCRMDSFV